MAVPNSQYSLENPRIQNLAFPRPIIFYLARNPVSWNGLRKLQKSCKLLFLETKIILVEGYCKSTILDSHPFVCKFSKSHQLYLLSTFIHIGNEPFGDLQKHIYRCDVNNLIIRLQDITLNEISFLLKSGTVNYLELWMVEIRGSSGVPVSMDTILAMTPRVERVCYSNKCETFSTETFKKLNSLTFELIFDVFDVQIYNVSDTMNAEPFMQFFNENFNHLRLVFVYFSANAFPSESTLNTFRDGLTDRYREICSFDVPQI